MQPCYIECGLQMKNFRRLPFVVPSPPRSRRRAGKMHVTGKCASRSTQEKCTASDLDPAINLSCHGKRAVSSLLFLQSTRHSFEASSSFLYRVGQRPDRSGDCDEAS